MLDSAECRSFVLGSIDGPLLRSGWPRTFYSESVILQVKRPVFVKSVEYREPLSRRTLRFRRMSPEERVNIALELSSSVISITMESIKNRNPQISTARLLEMARKRFRAGRKAESHQKHIDDICAILENTKVDKRKIIEQAKKEGTVGIFKEILQSTQIRKIGNRSVQPKKMNL